MLKTSYYAEYVQLLSKAEKQELLRFHGEGKLCATLVQKQLDKREEKEKTYRERYYAYYGKYPSVKQPTTPQPTSNK
jgi:hypothetical protein